MAATSKRSQQEILSALAELQQEAKRAKLSEFWTAQPTDSSVPQVLDFGSLTQQQLLDLVDNATQADCALLIGGRLWYGHSKLLSSLFRDLLGDIAAETCAGGFKVTEVPLPHTDPHAVRLLLDWLYTGKKISSGQLLPYVAEVGQNAHYIGAEDLEDKCAKMLALFLPLPARYGFALDEFHKTISVRFMQRTLQHMSGSLVLDRIDFMAAACPHTENIEWGNAVREYTGSPAFIDQLNIDILINLIEAATDIQTVYDRTGEHDLTPYTVAVVNLIPLAKLGQMLTAAIGRVGLKLPQGSVSDSATQT